MDKLMGLRIPDTIKSLEELVDIKVFDKAEVKFKNRISFDVPGEGISGYIELYYSVNEAGHDYPFLTHIGEAYKKYEGDDRQYYISYGIPETADAMGGGVRFALCQTYVVARNGRFIMFIMQQSLSDKSTNKQTIIDKISNSMIEHIARGK